MSVHHKVKPLYQKIIAAAEELGVTIIIDKMYIIHLETGETTTMQIMQTGINERRK